MSELYDDIARGCLENGEPIEARWGSGEWTRQPEQEQPPTDMDIWNDLQRQNDQLKAENERLREALREIASLDDGNSILKYYERYYRVFKIANEALKEVTK